MLKLNNVHFAYGNTLVLKDISFTVPTGNNVAIIGESGCGKSTLLKLIYGEFDIPKGEIFWNNTQIRGPKYNLVVGYSFMKYVTQEFDLMPFTSVEDNIGKHLSRFYPEEKQQRTNTLLEVVELQHLAKTKVKHLSGGQKQRVALARALAKKPEILLLDEPFSHIDNFKTQTLRRNVFAYLKAQNITCIVATHHKDDVLGFADMMLVLHNQRILANNTPKTLYNNPKTPLIASFFGEFSCINNHIYYAHQLKIVTHSNYKAEVSASYFNGADYLIALSYQHTTVFVIHDNTLPIGNSVCFDILV